MTNVLTVDCSADELIVCAIFGGAYAESRSGGAQRHNGAVLGCVDKVMTALGAKPSDFDAFAAVVGPGSFTGIRIGVATIKALCLATGKPSVAIDALEAIAYGEGECIAAIDARNGNCYAARFDKEGNMLEEKLMPRAQADAAGVVVIDARPDDIGKRLTAIAVEKVESKRFDAALEPKYLRKSQAERMKDGD